MSGTLLQHVFFLSCPRLDATDGRYVAIGQLKLVNNFIQIFSSRKVNICMAIYNCGIKYLPKTIVVIKS